MKKILVLGSTGSIGKQALEVIAESDGLELVGLAAGANDRLLAEQAASFGVRHLAIVDEGAGARLEQSVPEALVSSGAGCVRRLIEIVDCDLVLNAVMGAAGLEATVAALEKGVDLALANKESLVVGGDFVMDLARRRGSRILPVDSEHSAIFQCLQGQEGAGAERLFLTASGGPFRGRSRAALEKVSIEDALNHPQWQMGSKITIDSATLMNKGLEVIEAHYLFGVGYDDIEVLVHPQSIVHSLVRFHDGSMLAQVGVPSMKLPIAYALNFPERLPVVMPRLDLAAQQELTFFKPDLDAFPCLRIAVDAGMRGGGAPIVINAANEVAVAAFLAGHIRFLDIPEIVEQTLETMDDESLGPVSGLDEIGALDHEARQRADALVLR